MSFPGAVGLGISSDNMKNVCFIHIHGGKLYEIRTTSHMLYEIDIFLKGLNPSLAKPSLHFEVLVQMKGVCYRSFSKSKSPLDVSSSHLPCDHLHAISSEKLS